MREGQASELANTDRLGGSKTGRSPSGPEGRSPGWVWPGAGWLIFKLLIPGGLSADKVSGVVAKSEAQVDRPDWQFISGDD